MTNSDTNMNSSTILSSEIANDLGLTKTEDGKYAVPSQYSQDDIATVTVVSEETEPDSPDNQETEEESQGDEEDSEGTDEEDSTDGSSDSQSSVELLLQLAERASFFHTPKDEAFATYPVGTYPKGTGWDTSRVKSKSFEEWLRHKYYCATESAPPSHTKC
jgi:hypothetical protein